MREGAQTVRAAREAFSTALLYMGSARRILALRLTAGPEERLVFVIGAPRSGTTFFAGALGAQPGFVDLGEVKPLKAAIPDLVRLDEDVAAERFRAILERVRMLGLARGVRGVEQTPETVFVVGAALRAYPNACAIHLVRDGRDVVCSLLERGWLRTGRDGTDDAGLALGAHARFWVEPERAEEFVEASEATRAAWAWRRYAGAGLAHTDRTIELRYEALVAGPAAAAEQLAETLRIDPGPLVDALSLVHGESVGRFERDLTADQLADVEREAGALLADLGYT